MVSRYKPWHYNSTCWCFTIFLIFQTYFNSWEKWYLDLSKSHRRVSVLKMTSEQLLIYCQYNSNTNTHIHTYTHIHIYTRIIYTHNKIKVYHWSFHTITLLNSHESELSYMKNVTTDNGILVSDRFTPPLNQYECNICTECAILSFLEFKN